MPMIQEDDFLARFEAFLLQNLQDFRRLAHRRMPENPEDLLHDCVVEIQK